MVPRTEERQVENKQPAFRVRNWTRDEQAATATEYAVLLALIIVVSIATISTFGNSVATSVFGSVNALFGS